MNQFYVALIFFGIILIFFSLIWVVLGKKKVFSFMKNFDEKKQELVEIINDAEQMIEELNKFSDYIVTQMDLKNEELRVNLKKADKEVKNLANRADEIITARVVNGDNGEMVVRPQEPLFKYNSDIVIESMDFGNTSLKTVPVQKTPIRRTEKVIQINNKYTEVLRLSECGFDDVEIAKKLNMGKGEIELILGLSK